MAYRSTDKTHAHMAQQREKLLSAAREIVTNNGFSALTIVAIARRSGLAVSSVYNNFKSKDQLLLQVYSDRTNNDLLIDLA